MRSGSKLLAVLVAAVLTVGVGACGGDDEQGTASEATTAPSDGGQAKGGEASIEEFGSEAEGAEREEILAVFGDYFDALAAENYGAACARLAATVQGSLAQLTKGGGDCAVALPKLLAATAGQIAREQADGEIVKVRVEGDRAFVVFKAPGAKLYQLTMVEEDGEWKTSTVASSVLVPDL